MRAGDFERDGESGLYVPRRRGLQRAHPEFMCGPAFFGGGSSTPTDPYFSSVGLLLHGDGANGSATTVDSSSFANTITAVNSARLSTTQAKWGPSSLSPNFGASNRGAFTAPSSSLWDFGTGDFTAELWIYPTSNTTTKLQGLIARDAIGGTRGWLLYLGDGTSGSTVRALSFAAWSGGTLASILTTNQPPVNTWSFVALRRTAGVFDLAVGSTVIGTDSSHTSLSIGSSGTPICVGALYGTSDTLADSAFYGYEDDVRVTKGISRPLVTPTAAFPNS